MDEIIVRNTDLPYFIRGQVLLDADGNYNIYINSRLSQEIQAKTLLHEMNHVHNQDFDNNEDIRAIEKW